MKLFFYMMCLIFCGYMNVCAAEVSKYNLDPQDQKIVVQVIEDFSREMKEKNGIILLGNGGGRLYNGLWCVLVFELNHIPIDQTYARQLILNCSDEFLHKIKERKDLTPDLLKFPFTARNLNFIIHCIDENGDNVEDPFISVVASMQGELVYKTSNPELKDHFKSVKRETREEAYTLLKKDRKNIN